jgi:hypothetical protein
MDSKITTAQAMEHLREAMQQDTGYAWSWHCNIAVPMQDSGISHRDSNIAAVRLMKHMFDIDTSKFKEYVAMG